MKFDLLSFLNLNLGGPEAGSDEDSDWTPEMHKGFRGILSKLSSSKRDATVAIERFSEYLAYNTYNTLQRQSIR